MSLIVDAPASTDAIAAAVAAYSTQADTPLEVPAVAAAQLRDELGRYAAAPAEGEPAGEQPLEETLDEQFERELEEHRRAQLSDEERAAEDAAAADAGDPAEGEDGVFTVEIRARREGEEPVTLELPGLDQQTQELVRAALNDGMRRDEFNRQQEALQTARREIEEFEDAVAADPVGVALQYMRAEDRRDLVLTLLSQDEDLYDAVAEETTGWEDDPRERELAAHRLRQARSERSDTVLEDVRGQREARAHAEALWTAVTGLVPEGAEDVDAVDFMADARSYLQGIARQREITVQEIPALLERRVARYFAGTASRSAAPATPVPPAPPAPTVARPASPEAEALQRRVQDARGTGKRFVQGSLRRQEVAASAPAGAGGAPTLAIKAPAGAGIKEAVAHFRKQGHL